MGVCEAFLLQALADGGDGGGVGWQRDPRILRKWRAQYHLFFLYRSDRLKEKGKPERGFQTQMPTELDIQ